MTKHDEVRQILHENGFKFEDGRSALEMTDEEVEKWLVHFMAVMTDLGRNLAASFQAIAGSVVQAIRPLQNLTRLLEEGESEDAPS